VAPRSLGVIGGGTAGWLAALAIKRQFPHDRVTVVESRDVPIIGVGEATTTLMPPFLHAQLGLDVVELFRAVRPTFKLGIRFEWGRRDFSYPFGDANPASAAAHDGNLDNQSLVAMLMAEDRVPIFGERSQLSRRKFAYHLDNQPFVAFLTRASAQAGVAHEFLTLDEVVRGEAGIECLRGEGRELRFDLYVDATGFRSLLLDSPFLSYASSLFCDRAVVATVPGTCRPYTTAETMSAGWCWRIPVRDEDHRGYVFSSAFLDDDSAVAEMRARNPGMGDPSLIKFRSGRHEHFWKHNCVAVGNAYGFVEPLESTALHMVIVEIAYLLAALADPSLIDYANQSIASHWDFLRWFLAIHYKFNQRLDTPFWRAARAETDSSGLDEVIAQYRDRGLDSEGFSVGDPAFGYSGVMTLLLGQEVMGSLRPRTTREKWQERVATDRALVTQALSQRDALILLDARPELLRDFAESGWCRGSAERVVVSRAEMAHPRKG
jgi:tryptophan halogenase